MLTTAIYVFSGCRILEGADGSDAVGGVWREHRRRGGGQRRSTLPGKWQVGGGEEGRKEGGADVCCMLYVICYILYIVCYILYIGVVKGITALFRIDHRDV